MHSKPRIIAYYLPQYHPIAENDLWWGKGFTEWTNVCKAKSLFPGHQQPKIPGELGYYDLRVPETRQAQADIAREYGIEGFCYWHYWFGNGKQLLERPFNEVLLSGEPDFPFCIAWANESWKGFWHGLKDRQTLIEQTYPGPQDHEKHFLTLLPAFKDPRYIKVDNKPIFVVYKPSEIPNVSSFIKQWRQLAFENNIGDFYFVGYAFSDNQVDSIIDSGFNAVNLVKKNGYKSYPVPIKIKIISLLLKIIYNCKDFTLYEHAYKYFISDIARRENVFPTIIPNWDHSPRTGREGNIIHGSNPNLFRRHLLEVKNVVKEKKGDNNLIFVKSWNEWGEGNYLEPDNVYGRQYLQMLHEIFTD